MAFDSKGLDSYVDVAQRLADFRELYPEGSLQPADLLAPFEIRKVDGVDGSGRDFTATMIVYTAAAYRHPGDQRPGIGMAWEVFPGRTTFTKGSELMNAETSAWGRAILAALASDSRRGVASREEVRNRAAERDEASGPQPPRALADLPRNQDGSISRSRCTQEELEAAGILTGDKRAEHNALRNGADGKLPPGEHVKLRRCSPGNPCAEADCPQCTPDADLWQEAPPAPGLRTPKPAQSLPAQIAMHFDRLGYSDRDVRLGITAQLAGTGRIGSSKELNVSQARQVLDVLAKCRDGAALRAHLDGKREEVGADA